MAVHPLSQLADLLPQVQESLAAFGEADNFHENVRLAFGSHILTSAIDELASRLITKDPSLIPSVEVRTASELNGALGAFAAETNQIFLSENLLEPNNSDLAVAVLLEEIGHGLDLVLNPDGDAVGDEGNIFSNLVRGVELNDDQLQSLRAEDDSTTLTIDGQTLAVEQATIVVNTLVDELDNSIMDGDISLRDALAAATSGETITFANGLSGGTINLNAALGDLDIETSLSIQGDLNGDGNSDITIDAQGNSRVLNIYDGDYNNASTVSLSGLTITGGSTTNDGGGIYNYESLTIVNSTISGNSANDGGGIYNGEANLTVVNSTISGNSAAEYGGGIYHFYGILTVVNSTISGNSANYIGGGIYSATDLEDQSTTITNSTIANNSAGTGGGGIYNIDGQLFLNNSTVTLNTAPEGRGSGVFSYGDNLTLTTVTSSIISGNTNSDIDFASDPYNVNSFVSGNNNLIGTGNALGNFNQSEDTTGVTDPGLVPAGLQDNGGPTETIALETNSPAIDGGNSNAAINLDESELGIDFNNDGDTADIITQVSELAFDQRGDGFPRSFGGEIDIGAFESGGSSTAVVEVLLNGQGNLIITGLDEATIPETLALNISPNGNILRVSSVDTILQGGGMGVFQVNDNQVNIPLANITGNSGIIINNQAGSDVVEVNLDNASLPRVRISGGPGNDTLQGQNTNATRLQLIGDVGNDLLDGGRHNDTLNGGNGSDTLNGRNGNDTLIGGGGRDRLIGGNGNDSLDGGLGIDTLIGGSGNDTYVVDNANDVVTENNNAGVDTVRASITYALGANVERLTLFGGSSINGTGNGLNNILIGNNSQNVLNGGNGNDTINGGNGNDTLIGGGGRDTLNGGGGRDRLVGGAANDSLNGGGGIDTLIGGSGNDIFVVNSANDVVTEGNNAGIDTVRSSSTFSLGANVERLTLLGGANINGSGNGLSNILTGNNGQNVLNGGNGNDTLNGGNNNDTLNGGAGNDRFVGGSGRDRLVGGSGNDSLIGGSGNDTLIGGIGRDTITGGNGADTIMVNNFNESRLANFDRLTDFAIGTDRLVGPNSVSASNVAQRGMVAALNAASIQSLLTVGSFGANDAATFRFGSRVFLALNDSTAGFSAANDSIVELTGFSGALSNLAIF